MYRSPVRTLALLTLVPAAAVAGALLVATAPARSDPAPTLVHVAPAGSDDGPGTAADPLATVQTAVDRLGPAGGTVVLAGGTYADQRVLLAGVRDVALLAAPGQNPVLDAAGLRPPEDDSGVVEVRDSSGVTVRGLEITGYRSADAERVPVGILVTGAGRGITLDRNHVHDLGGHGDAHGIAAYGTDPDTPLAGLRITGNEVDHLTLGSSEAVAVNGNVSGWEVSGNSVHDVDNIGIDAIGAEETVPGPARYGPAGRARNGLIAGNTVSDVSAAANPAYEGGCRCAGGIYVDGAASVRIEGNTVHRADIGIEVGAEDPRGHAEDVTVTGNTVTGAGSAALALGGYDADRGRVSTVTVTGNILATAPDADAVVLLQHHLSGLTLEDNRLFGAPPVVRA